MNAKPVSLLKNVGLIFFIVSGGAYGLETLVSSVGPYWAVIMVAVVPIFWVLPVSMMVMELSTALPEAGGYYYWVKRSLGRFWGFQEGWWTLCYSVFDLAIYPVLFVAYLGFFFPELKDPYLKWALSAGFIFLSVFANLLGLRWLGRQILIQLVFVVLPFLIFIFDGLVRPSPQPFTPGSESFGFGAFGTGLAIVLWNYCGWDNVSTYVNEVQSPEKNFVRAMWVSILLVTATYILPIVVGVRFVADPKMWGESSGWPAIAETISGHGIALWIAAGAIISTSAQFSGQLLYLSRLAMPMVDDRTLPQFLTRKRTKTGEPVGFLLLLATSAAILSSLALSKLVVIDILFYGMGLLLEFLALIKLRHLEPDLLRPFKIRLSSPGLYVLMAMPALAIGVVAWFTLNTPGERWQLWIVLFLASIGIGIGWKKKNQNQIPITDPV